VRAFAVASAVAGLVTVAGCWSSVTGLVIAAFRPFMAGNCSTVPLTWATHATAYEQRVEMID
jgi:hypothetical protein